MKHIDQEIQRLSTNSTLQQRLKWILEEMSSRLDKIEKMLVVEEVVQTRPDPGLAKVEDEAIKEAPNHETRDITQEEADEKMPKESPELVNIDLAEVEAKVLGSQGIPDELPKESEPEEQPHIKSQVDDMFDVLNMKKGE